ncbi:MAG: ABC transporter ATP-binding protein [Marinilabiliaceae bacterium]|nr:ABC transporter ATP-binding protein [Marinilabiliaceae bacterium]
MRRTLRLIFTVSPRLSVIVALLILTRGAMPVVMLWAIKMMVDITLNQIGEGAIEIQSLITAVAILTGAYIINSASASLAQLMRSKLASRIGEYLSAQIHSKSIQLELSYFEDPDYQNIFFRAVAESAAKPLNVFYSLCSIIQGGVTLLLLSIVLISLHWVMPIAILLIGLPVVIIKVKASRRVFNLNRSMTTDDRLLDYYSRILTSKEFAKEIRIFGLGRMFAERHQELQIRLREQREKMHTHNVRRDIAGQVISTIGVVTLACIVIWRAICGDLTAGSLAMYFMAIQRSNSSAQEFMQSIAQLIDSNIFLSNLFDYLDLPVDKHISPANPTPFPSPIKHGIEVRNVSFSYPNSARKAIENVSFLIKPGATVAIVGPNGSGKTTLVKLLCGLYEPTEGEILIDGINMKQFRMSDIANNISAIFQDFMLYNTTARENIRLGNIKADNIPENIRKAAQDADIDRLLSSLPKGYDTTLGTLFAGSEMLSQGQWQRVALARSFFNHKAQIIFLDEPTSSLDRETQRALNQSFHKIMQERTAIIVSHSDETIKMADVVIDLGELKTRNS